MTVSWKVEDEIVLRGGKFVRLPDGIIIGMPTPTDMTLKDAQEIVALFHKLSPDSKLRILIDQRGVSRKLEAAARQYLVSALQESLDHLAIITGNTISRFFASGILATLGMSSKSRAFDSIDDALVWLRSFHASVGRPR
jgi:hypothetical protein